MKHSISIIQADAQVLAQNGLKCLAQKGGGIEKIDVAENAEQLLHSLKHHHYDLLVMDYLQPGFFNFFDLLKVRKLYPDLKILVISGDNRSDTIIQALDNGVQGYLTRQCDEDEIIQAIFSVASGAQFFCNKVMNVMVENTASPNSIGDCTPSTLSEREAEIICHVAKGFTTKEIADKLCLSSHTVSTHRKNILKKLEVKTVSEVIKYAINSGLVEA